MKANTKFTLYLRKKLGSDDHVILNRSPKIPQILSLSNERVFYFDVYFAFFENSLSKAIIYRTAMPTKRQKK